MLGIVREQKPDGKGQCEGISGHMAASARQSCTTLAILYGGIRMTREKETSK